MRTVRKLPYASNELFKVLNGRSVRLRYSSGRAECLMIDRSMIK